MNMSEQGRCLDQVCAAMLTSRRGEAGLVPVDGLSLSSERIPWDGVALIWGLGGRCFCGVHLSLSHSRSVC